MSHEWFTSAFGERYLELYAHRDADEAATVLAQLFPASGLRQRRVLDVGCGAGRYLAELERQGARAVGLDLSFPLLRHARSAGPQWSLVRADMRWLPFPTRSFDWVLSMFTSFGYFSSTRAHAALAAEFARVCRRGVIIDAPNGQVLPRTLVPKSSRRFAAGIVEEERVLEHDPLRVRKTIVLRGGAGGAELERYTEQVMLFTFDELSALFAPTGLVPARTLGDYAGSPFLPERSARMLVQLVPAQERQ